MNQIDNYLLVKPAINCLGASSTGVPYCVRMKNVHLIHSKYVCTENNEIPTESLHENWSATWVNYWLSLRGSSIGGASNQDVIIYSQDEVCVSKKRSGKMKPIDVPSLVFQYMYDHNFYHFLCSSLPRLNVLRLNEFSRLKVLVSRDTPSYQREMIDEIVPKEQQIIIDSQYDYLVSELYILDFPERANIDYSLEFYEFFRRSLEESYPEKYGSNKLYLSRSGNASEKRPISNKTQLYRLLDEYQFTSRDLATMDLRERVCSLRSADFILSEFSAGLASCVLCKPGTIVIVIEHPIYKMPKHLESVLNELGIRVLRIENSSVKFLLARVFWRIRALFTKDGFNYLNALRWSIPIKAVDRVLGRSIDRAAS